MSIGQNDADKSVALLAVDGDVATITLNRPSAYNAINYDLAVRLKALIAEIDAQPGIKVVVIRGAGAAFCGGGDIRHFVENLDNIGDCIRDLITPYHEFLARIHSMPKLVIASVHGSAAGAGLSLIGMCDLCIAADDAKFVPAYAKLGVSPDGGGTYGLARALGQRRALQVQMAGASFTADQAQTWGLVTKVAPAAELSQATADFAAQLARTSAEAIANTKRLLRVSERAALEDHLVDEMESLIRCMETPDFASAINRFVAKA